MNENSLIHYLDPKGEDNQISLNHNDEETTTLDQNPQQILPQNSNSHLRNNKLIHPSCWSIVYANTTVDTFRFKSTPIPKWLIKSTIKEFDRYKMSQPDKDGVQQSRFFNNFMGIIHRAAFEESSEIKDFNEIVEPSKKTMNLNLGLKFISVHCKTVTEA